MKHLRNFESYRNSEKINEDLIYTKKIILNHEISQKF